MNIIPLNSIKDNLFCSDALYHFKKYKGAYTKKDLIIVLYFSALHVLRKTYNLEGNLNIALYTVYRVH